MLTYADVCCRMLPYADVRCRLLPYLHIAQWAPEDALLQELVLVLVFTTETARAGGSAGACTGFGFYYRDSERRRERLSCAQGAGTTEARGAPAEAVLLELVLILYTPYRGSWRRRLCSNFRQSV